HTMRRVDEILAQNGIPDQRSFVLHICPPIWKVSLPPLWLHYSQTIATLPVLPLSNSSYASFACSRAKRWVTSTSRWSRQRTRYSTRSSIWGKLQTHEPESVSCLWI